MSVKDLVEISQATKFVAGLPVAEGQVGGDPGPTPATASISASAPPRNGRSARTASTASIAIQGAGSVARRLARRAAADGARISIADIDAGRAQALAGEVGGTVVAPEEILSLEADILSPNALGAILNAETIPQLRVPVVAGGANNQLATPEDGDRVQQRGILYAPDYVINAGGIINVSTEYLRDGDENVVRERIEAIPGRLDRIWDESAATGRNPAAVADDMARRLIGRGPKGLPPRHLPPRG